MSKEDGMRIGRRGILKTSAAMLGGALLGPDAEASADAQIQQNVNALSSPSSLKITDLRVATVVKPGLSPCPIIHEGSITVPERPGLGVTLNEDIVRVHLKPGTGYFEPTTQWDEERSWDRLWS